MQFAAAASTSYAPNHMARRSNTGLKRSRWLELADTGWNLFTDTWISSTDTRTSRMQAPQVTAWLSHAAGRPEPPTVQLPAAAHTCAHAAAAIVTHGGAQVTVEMTVEHACASAIGARCACTLQGCGRAPPAAQRQTASAQCSKLQGSRVRPCFADTQLAQTRAP